MKFVIFLIVAIGIMIYYIAFDDVPKSVGDGLDQPESWCSNIYCN